MTRDSLDSVKTEALSSLLWKMMERGGRAVVELVVQIVMARLLAPGQFGALAIMLVFVNLGNVIVQSGLNTALIQSPYVDDDDYSTVFWMSLIISIALYMVIFMSAPLIANFYGMAEIVWPLRGLSSIFIINALNAVQVAKVTRDLQMRKVFNATLVSVLVSAILGIGAAVKGLGLWALVVQQVVYQLTSCFVLFIQVDWRPRLVFKTKRAQSLFSFGWRLLASGLLDQGYGSLSDLIIGKRFSSVSLGLVSQGKKYPNAVGSLLDGTIQPVMLSAISRVQTDLNAVKRVVRRALKTSTYLIAPSMTLFACIAPSMVPLLLGNQWSGCVPYMQIYCFIYALLPIHTTNLQALNGMGRSDLFLKLEIIKKSYGLVVLLFCAFVLDDIKLLVASYLLTDVLGTVVNSWPNKRVIGYSYAEQVRDIAPAFILSACSATVALVVPLANLTHFFTIVLQVSVFAASYIFLSKLMNLEELDYLISTVSDFMESHRGR